MELRDKFGGCCPSPEQDKFQEGHYKTFLEMLQTNYYIKSEKVISNTTPFGLCNRGCSFFSKADRDRHMRLMKLLFILKFK